MRTIRRIITFCVVLAGGVLIVVLGCCPNLQYAREEASRSPAYLRGSLSSEQLQPKAHGGTHNVNDAAFDAMFFRNYGVNPFVDVDDDNLSTFAIDVDTGSYTLCRSYLQRNAIPPKDAVRVEEFVNYFDYGYSQPTEPHDVFALHSELAPSEFGGGKMLFRIGIKAREINPAQRKDAILTFVIDVSGSMAREDRLGLVKKSLRMLVDQLHEGDRIGIAVYGSNGRNLLDHCGTDERADILAAIDRLEPDGSTNAEEGLNIGYKMAKEAFREGAINRVILCSDGVANVGNTGPKSILRTIEKQVSAGITLSTVGFGMGNYNDVLMEQLADKGNGNYAYVDTLSEARRIFVENLTGTLQLVARDVKVQVDFDSHVVRSYRLLGYENRDVADDDFRDDKVDGGEVGAGHSVTAFYELKLWPEKQGRVATVYIRHKDPDTPEVREITQQITTSDVLPRFNDASASFRLAACVAEFSEILRLSYWARDSKLEKVLALAKQCRADYDHRQDIEELVHLIDKSHQLKADQPELASSSTEQ